METFKIIPILGRKTDVPANDITMFKPVSQGVVLTHDAGGVNFDLNRKRNACTKSNGYVEWSSSATAQATKCMGLFEWYDGTNRHHAFFDNGKCYIYDSSFDPVVKEDAGTTTFANDNGDFYSMIQVGPYMVFADRAEHTPYKWTHGDANLTKLIASGTEYKFRYLVPFQRRVIGLYSDQSSGDIEVRWSTDWPTTAITSLNFPAANQLYIPTDDSIVGGATMGTDKCFIYSENSINQLVYYPDYSTPFRLFTAVPQQGSTGHFSIVNLGNRHLFFNRNYGFCQYTGGNDVVPISMAIEKDIQEIDPEYYDLIYGTYIPLTRTVVWTVPKSGNTAASHLFFYDIDTGNWTIEDKAMRCVADWRMSNNFTWSDFGGAWTIAGSRTWAYYTTTRSRLVYANTDGNLYYQAGESINGSIMDGYRIEPILDFGLPHNYKFLKEVWFEVAEYGLFGISMWHRSGNTVGELESQPWTSVGGVFAYGTRPVAHINQNARFHQIKWGTTQKDNKFMINGITFKYEIGSNV